MTASTTGFERTTETDMVNDDDRREVAARLRELHLGGGSKDLIERTLSDAIGAWRESGMSWDFITERLADLIEPPACPSRAVRAYAEEVDWHTGESPLVHELRGIADRMDRECAPVDRDALLALADGLCDGYPYGLSHGGLEQLARRIRDALGVTDG